MKRSTILLVDDDPLLRKALRLELRRDFEVVEAASYAAGVSAVANLPELAAVISDFDLGPGPNGLELLAAARSRRPEAHRIMISGSVPPATAKALVGCGLAVQVFEKPWEPGAVRAAVRELLGHLASGPGEAAPSRQYETPRRSPRYPAHHVSARIRFPQWRRFRRAAAVNLSNGGMLLGTASAPRPGQLVLVSIQLSGGGQLELAARVRHVQGDPDEGYRVGVQFEAVDRRRGGVLVQTVAELSAG